MRKVFIFVFVAIFIIAYLSCVAFLPSNKQAVQEDNDTGSFMWVDLTNCNGLNYSVEFEDLQEQTKDLRKDFGDLSAELQKVEDFQLVETQRINKDFNYTESIEHLEKKVDILSERKEDKKQEEFEGSLIILY